MEQFQPGDVVALKSDPYAPHMTVREVQNNWVYTVWFDRETQLQYGAFLPITLKKVS